MQTEFLLLSPIYYKALPCLSRVLLIKLCRESVLFVATVLSLFYSLLVKFVLLPGDKFIVRLTYNFPLHCLKNAALRY